MKTLTMGSLFDGIGDSHWPPFTTALSLYGQSGSKPFPLG